MTDITETIHMEVGIKLAAIKASPSVVCVITHKVPADMIRRKRIRGEVDRKHVFSGAAVIIECVQDSSEGRYISTAIAPATLFKRSNGVEPNDIEVDVYQSGGNLFKGEVLACDFHYNLAAIRIQSDSPLQIAILRGLDDFSITDLTEHCQRCEEKPFQLNPHSSLFKILSGTRVITLSRSSVPPFNLQVYPGVISICKVDCSLLPDCKELLWVKYSDYKGNGAPAINCYGEVIGMMADETSFLPSNFVSRWWNHYKSCREFCRPWCGVKLSSLSEACIGFMEQFVSKFPNIVTGVVVTKIAEDFQAYCSRLQADDVIVKCDGKVVRSKLEFFEKLWDNVGKPVELNVLRACSGGQLNISMTIGKVMPDKFYWWPSPLSEVIKIA